MKRVYLIYALLISLISVVNARDKDSQFSVYPNPFEDRISIQPTTAEKQLIKVSLFDVLGNCKYQSQFVTNNGQEVIVLEPSQEEALKSGIYFLSVNDGVETRTFRLIRK